MKRTLLYYFTVFLLSILCTQSKAQTVEDSLLERIAYYQEVDSFELFYNSLKNLSRHYKTYDNRFEKVVNIFQKNKPYRDPKTKEESILIRGYYASLIYALKKSNDNPALVLETALIAHDYVFDENKLDKYAWYIENDIGHLYAKLDDFDSALYYYNKTESYLKNSNQKEYYCRLLLNIGKVYLWNRDTINAKRHFLKSLESAKSNKEKIAISAAYEKLCSFSLEIGDLESYKKHKPNFLKCLETTLNDPDRKKRYRELLLLDATYYNITGSENRSIALFDSLISIYEADKLLKLERTIPKLRLKKVSVLIKQNKFNLALRELVKARDWFTDYTIDNTLVDINLQQARLIRKLYPYSMDSLLLSIEFYRRALYGNKKLNESFLYGKSSKQSTEKSRMIIEEALEVLFEEKLYSTSQKKVIKLIRMFFDESKNNLTEKKMKRNANILNLDIESKQRIDSLTFLLVTVFSTSSENRDSIEKVVFDLKKNISDLVGLETENKDKKITSDYIEFVYGKKYCYVLLQINKENSLVKIRREKMDNLHKSMNSKLLNKGNEQSIFRVGKEFSELLGLDNILLNEKMIIIPDGPLFVFPFDLLVYKNKYLIHNTAISLQPSIYIQNYGAIKKPSIVFHIPTYPDLIFDSENQDRSSIYKLKHVKEEIKGIGSVFNDCRSIAKLSNNILSESLGGVSIYHFAGHARAFQDSAYLLLGEDLLENKLTFDQIQNQALDLELVTLSACETGLGEFVYGDGLNSLARGFETAGAKSVLSSLWTVNDRSTSQIMLSFYRHLKGGLEKDNALRLSKLKFVKEANPQYKHPYYWSGFALQGETSSLNESNTRFWTKGLLAILLIFLFIKYFKI